MAYINAEEVKAIRTELKREFGNTIKFSVTREHMSGVNIKVVESKADFGEYLGDRGNISISDYNIDTKFASDEQILIHHNSPDELSAVFKKIFAIAKTAPAKYISGAREWFDESDSMTDYFHTAYYINAELGSWDKAWKLKT
jgi:adenylyl- and sulfurtransferase ThiI